MPVLDVGLNGYDYTPVSFDKIKGVMDSKEVRAVDHHTGNGSDDS